jgi:hypothetical protein
MFERLKRAMVESFVGTVALGYLLAQCIMHFVGVFAAPIQDWVARKEYRDILSGTGRLTGFPFDFALPELVRFFLLLLVWYVLLRWLYFKPVKKVPSEPASDSGQPT